MALATRQCDGLDPAVMAMGRLAPFLREAIVGPARAASPPALRAAQPEGLPRCQVDLIDAYQDDVYATFMSSQGRQYVQPVLLDARERLVREMGIDTDWDLMESTVARRMMRQRRIPRGHTRVPEDQQESVFELWLQMGIWIGRYVAAGDAAHLPTHEELDWFIYEHLEMPTSGSSSTVEEVSGIKLVLDRYRAHDPEAQLGTDEAIWRYALPALIRGDDHWVSNPRTAQNPTGRRRPGSTLMHLEGGMSGPHRSAIRTLLPAVGRKQARGEPLTPVETIYMRMSRILDAIELLDPTFETLLPAYRALIDGYNGHHPDEAVSVLHRAD